MTVRTTGGSVWGGDGTLIEEVVIGTETRGEDDLLGQVMGIDATVDRIFIADNAFTMVRVFDMAGDHLMNIGRHGGGPGEFFSITDLGIDPLREHLIVRESSGILHRLTLSGEYVETLRPALFGSWIGPDLLLRVTRDGVPIVPHSSWRKVSGGNMPMAEFWVLYTIDSTGAKVDSLDLPVSERELFMLRVDAGPGTYHPEPVPFGPQDVWSVGWDGALITGYTAEYRFQVRYRDGRRTVIEKEAEQIQVLPGEREWATRRVFGIMRGFNPGWAWKGPKIPQTKPWYRAVIPDRSGRLWVLREGEGRPVEGWIEPKDGKGWSRNPAWISEQWFDVFEEATGRYLGRVDAPDGFLLMPEPVIEGNTFICLTEDGFGRPIVRRYRLHLPVGGENPIRVGRGSDARDDA